MFISFIGDSLVNGVNDPEGLGWAGRLCVEARSVGHDLTMYNLGVRRNSTRDILARWEDEVARRMMPGAGMHLVFAFGVVDMVEDNGELLVPEEESLENAREILQKASAEHPTLMLGPPAMADPMLSRRIEDLNARYETLCGALNVPYLNILPDLKESEFYLTDLISGDGVHPGAAGYNHIFHLVAGWPAWRAWFQST